MSRRADLATLAVAIAVHLGFALALAHGQLPRPRRTSTVELELTPPPSRPSASAARRAAAPSVKAPAARPAPARRRVALRQRPVTPPPPAPALAPPPATPQPPARPRPMFAVAMASTSEVVAAPVAAPLPAAGVGPDRAGSAPGGRVGGHGAAGAASGDGPASESEVTAMPEIDTDACGRTIVYPRDAEDAGIEGDVRLRVSLSAAGRVEAVRVLSGPGHGLEREAVQALEHRCRFTPAIGRGGKPVAFVIASYTFHFELPR